MPAASVAPVTHRAARACAACDLRAHCLTERASRRYIYRREHESVIERHRARMLHATMMMQRRKELAEHPFGALKCRVGYRHFRVRGFNKVRGEWRLIALCYNLMCLMNILGLAVP